MADETGRLIILFRHGIAEERTAGKSDEERALTADGQKKMKENARGLADLLPQVDGVISSPLVRAVQTSLFIARACGLKGSVRTSEALRPDAPVEQMRELMTSTKGKVLVFVGHEPTLSNALAEVTGIAGSLELKKGGCYLIRLSQGSWKLEAMLTPRLLRRLTP